MQSSLIQFLEFENVSDDNYILNKSVWNKQKK